MMISFLFILNLWAQTSNDDLSKKYLAVIKEKEVETNLMQQVQGGACAPEKQAGPTLEEKNKQALDCFNAQLNKLPETEIQNFSKSIDLHNYDIEVTKNAESIRKYLSQRLERGLYGDVLDPVKMRDPNYVKKLKMVGQNEFFKLYKAQIGKNILLEVSQYCLENLRTSSGDYIAPVKGAKGNYEMPAGGLDPSKLKEIEFDNKKITNEENHKQSIKEFNYGSDFLKSKYVYCANAISAMCENYACKNSLNIQKDLSGSCTPPAPGVTLSDTDKNQGRIACIIQNRMKDYRKVLTETDLNEAELNKFIDTNGYQYAGGFYSEKTQGSSINDLTTVSSKEIEATDKSAEDLKAFEQCAQKKLNDAECQKYLASGGEQDFRKLEADFHANTLVKEKEIGSLKDAELEKYLTDNGLNDELKLFKAGQLKEDQVKLIMKNKFEAERLAIIAQIKDEFKNKTVKTDPNSNFGKSEAEIKQEVKEDLETRKDRLSNLFHYSNIITSYLEVKGADNKLSSNLMGLQKEKAALEEAQVKDMEYFNTLEKGQNMDQDTGAAISVNLSLVDAILGNEVTDDSVGTKEEKEKAKKKN